MTELLTICRPFMAEAPWGKVHVWWDEPRRIDVVVFHFTPGPGVKVRGVNDELFYAESGFSAIVTGNSPSVRRVRVSHEWDRRYLDHSGASRRSVLRVEQITTWRRRIADWLAVWIDGQTPNAALARAVAHHNLYVRLRSKYVKIPASELASHEKRMLWCLVHALPAARWLATLPRRDLREFVVLNYVPFVGRAAQALTLRDLNLGDLRQ